ncbi:hypothetical protein [Aldersonia kunmingensis]|uniref:hypothetical protein n=1 Tax=Aldersonia kunmingensis TaxID=408066 RepID=UPI0012ED19E8|nr:hypothetical protein [Aldersonia kunmingensis]
MSSSKGRHRPTRTEIVVEAAKTPVKRAIVVGSIPLALAVAASGMAVAAPSVDQPGTATQQPGTTTQQPEETTPNSAQPGATAPNSAQPGATAPNSAQPGATTQNGAKPGTNKPNSADPTKPNTEQPGTTSPSQPGTTSVTPAQPGTSAVPAPAPGAATPRTDLEGRGLIPDPPVLPSREVPTYDSSVPQPDYTYSQPAQSGDGYSSEIVVEQAKPSQSFAPIAPPENKIRFGDFVTDRPDWIAPDAALSANRWAAYAESEIARTWNRAGVTPDRADRLAATATATGAAGGAIGAVVGAVAAIPAAAAAGVIGGGIGSVIGSAPGAAVGAAIGVVGVEVIGAGIGAAAGGAIGVAAGTALSGGDPNLAPVAPQVLPTPHEVAQFAIATTNNTVDWVKAQPGGAQALAAVPPAAAQAAAMAKATGPVGEAIVNAAQQANDAFVAWQVAQPGGTEIVAAAQETGAGMPTEVAQIGGAAHSVYYAG